MTQLPLFDRSEFERFDGLATRRKDPAVSIQARGSISINQEAYNAMARPVYVSLFYNPKRGQILLEAAEQNTPGAARARANGKGMGALIATKTFFDRYSIPYEESYTAQIITLSEGLAVVQLPDGSGERQ